MSKHENCLDQCIACTACVVSCPVTAATNKFRGPKMSGPALERFRLMGDGAEEALDYCSNCKNCDITCPSGVSASTINMLSKAKDYKRNRHSLRDWMLSHGELMAKLSMPTSGLTNIALKNPITKFMLKKLGITSKRSLPAYASKTFGQLFKAIKQESFENKVVFYPGCFINYNEPQVGLDAVKVLQKNGYEVLLPEVVCCGSPLIVNGYLDEVEQHAHKNVIELNYWLNKGYPVITACTSCGLMLKQEYQELFNINGLSELATGIYDIFEFLENLNSNHKMNTDFRTLPGKYLYHAPCHLRVQGIGKPSMKVLQAVLGLELDEAAAGCCGISGSYGFKEDKYEISMAIGEELFEKIRESRADAVITECGTCRLQIKHGTGAKTLHPISLLADAY